MGERTRGEQFVGLFVWANPLPGKNWANLQWDFFITLTYLSPIYPCCCILFPRSSHFHLTSCIFSSPSSIIYQKIRQPIQWVSHLILIAMFLFVSHQIYNLPMIVSCFLEFRWWTWGGLCCERECKTGSESIFECDSRLIWWPRGTEKRLLILLILVVWNLSFCGSFRFRREWSKPQHFDFRFTVKHQCTMHYLWWFMDSLF